MEIKNNFNTRVLSLNNQYDIQRELTSINVDKRAFDLLVANMEVMYLKLEQVDTRVANTIKQEVIKIGGEVAISKEAYSYTARTTDMLICASRKNIGFLAKKLASKQYEMNEIAREIESCLDSTLGVTTIGKTNFDFHHLTYISGVVKYKQSLFGTPVSDTAIMRKVEKFYEAGVDIIELLGGYTNSNKRYELVSDEDKAFLSRIILQIKKQFPTLVVTTDAIDVELAKVAVEAGVDAINNVVPIRYNQELLRYLSKINLPMFLMHSPSTDRHGASTVPVSDVVRDIQANLNFAISNGIAKDKIIIDPSISFGRKEKDNFLLLRQLSGFKYLKTPVSVTVARKNFLSTAMPSSMRKTQLNSAILNLLAIINSGNIIRIESVEQAGVFRGVLDLIRPNIPKQQ